MKLQRDTCGAVDFDAIEKDTTVQQLLDAVDDWLEAHPLDCAACEQSCCRKAWSVEVDNVSVHRLCGGDAAAAGRFVREKLVLKRNHALGFNQFVLNKKTDCLYIGEDNRCRIYAMRPVICRLYMCGALSARYDMLRGVVGATYLQALVLEEAQRREEHSQAGANPALGARDYSLRLTEILCYAAQQGWLEDEDRAMLLAENGGADIND